MTPTQRLLALAAEIAEDAEDMLPCNCADACEGTCTHARAVRLRETLQTFARDETLTLWRNMLRQEEKGEQA